MDGSIMDIIEPAADNYANVDSFAHGNMGEERDSLRDAKPFQDGKMNNTISVEIERIHIKQAVVLVENIGYLIPGGARSVSYRQFMHKYRHVSSGSDWESADGSDSESSSTAADLDYNQSEGAVSTGDLYPSEKCTSSPLFNVYRDGQSPKHSCGHCERHPTYEISCIKCPEDYIFKTWRCPDAYRHHLFLHDGNKSGGEFQCDGCDARFDEAVAMETHSKIHHNKTHVFKCQLCPKSFTRGMCYTIHQTVHTGIKAFKCPHCNKPFQQEGGVAVHLRNVHKLNTFKKVRYHDGVSKSCGKCVDLHPNYVAHCRFCSVRKHCPEALKFHHHLHTGDSEESKWSCEKCDAKFGEASHLETHTKIHHHSVHTFVCAVCYVTFQRSSLYELHQKVHSKERRISCSRCRKSFKTRASLKSHIKAKHENPRKFACHQCDRVFNWKSNLSTHLKLIHTSADSRETYKCAICGHTANTKPGLQSHLLVHEEKKAHVCPTCGKAFKRDYELKHHQMAHGDNYPHRCDVCNKGFAKRSGMLNHARVHTDERPFECTTCGKSFAQRGTLITHVTTHSDYKPFVCDVQTCGEAYRTRQALVGHNNRCHPHHKQ